MESLPSRFLCHWFVPSIFIVDIPTSSPKAPFSFEVLSCWLLFPLARNEILDSAFFLGIFFFSFLGILNPSVCSLSFPLLNFIRFVRPVSRCLFWI